MIVRLRVRLAPARSTQDSEDALSDLGVLLTENCWVGSAGLAGLYIERHIRRRGPKRGSGPHFQV